jgi:hypothetical protein
MAYTFFEDALKFFAGSDYTNNVKFRGDVAPPGNSWYSAFDVHTTHTAPTPGYDAWVILPWTQTTYSSVTPSSPQASYGGVGVGSTTTTNNYTVVGVNLDSSKFGSGGVYHQFVQQTHDVLGGLIGSPYENDETSVLSFDAASKVLTDTEAWFQNWKQNVTQWSSGIDTAMSNWQGSAAGMFKAALVGFASELDNLINQLQAQKLSDTLHNSRSQLSASHGQLYNAFLGWMQSPMSNPVNTTRHALGLAVSNGWSVDNNGVIHTSLGDPTTQSFRDQVEQQAKQVWLDNVAQMLDGVTTNAMSGLNNSYIITASALSQSFQTPQMKLPPGTPPDTNPLGGGVGNLGGDLNGIGGGGAGGVGNGIGGGAGNLGGDLNGIGSGGAGGVGNTPGSASGAPVGGGGGAGGVGNIPGLASGAPVGGGGGAGGVGNIPGLASGAPVGGGGGAGGVGSIGLIPPSAVPTNSAGGNGSASGLGGAGSTPPSVVMDSTGQPVLGSNGMPLTVPAGSSIGPNGTVLGPNGQPVLSSAGRPLTVPQGSTLQPAATVVGPDGQTVMGPNGPVQVPAGSTTSPNGTILGPNGQPVLGGGGNPLTVPPGSSVVPGTGSLSQPSALSPLPSNSPLHVPAGSSISPDGTVLGPNGNPVLGPNGPISLPAGSHINPDGTVTGPNGQPLPNSSLVTPGGGPPISTTPLQSLPTMSSLPSNASGPFSGGPATLSSAAGGADKALTAGGLTGMTVGSDGQVLGGMSVPGGPTGMSPGSVTTSNPAGTTPGSSGTPFMPPMGGMGGMGGGAQPAEGQGRGNTWLAEDEEVWGTASEAPPGVIGRRRRGAAKKPVSGVAFPTSSDESLYGTERSEEGTDEFTIPGTA